MHYVYKAILLFLVLVFITTLHIGVTTIFPQPWNTVNVIFVLLVLFLTMTESRAVIWLALSAQFFIELYSISPFGIILYSGTMAMLFTYWISRYVFTNKTWYTAIALTAISLLLYRMLFILITIATTFFVTYDVSVIRSIRTFAWEILLSSLLAVILFIPLRHRVTQKKRSTIFYVNT